MERAGRNEAQILDAIGRVLRGEVGAFELIVREYQGMVSRICRSVVGNPDDVEDAVQEVFIRVYRSLSSFRLERRFTPWIVSIALNTAKSHYRKVGRIAGRTTSFPPELLRSESDPEREGERHLAGERVRAAVRRLPERLRGVVVLYYLEEMDVADVAESLGLGKENVKSRLHRARAVLRKILEGDATEGSDRE